MSKEKSEHHLTQTTAEKGAAVATCALAVLQMMLILGSWIVNAVRPDWHIRSLLSEEGIRWFVRSIPDNISGNAMVWLLLISMSYGAVRFSGLPVVLRNRNNLSFWEKLALTVSFAELLIIIILILLLTVVPHAILLGVTGKIFPGSFSRSFVPIACLTICIVSVTFGIVCGRLRSFSSVCQCLVSGIGQTKCLWLIYILAAELYASFRFVLIIPS